MKGIFLHFIFHSGRLLSDCEHLIPSDNNHTLSVAIYALFLLLKKNIRVYILFTSDGGVTVDTVAMN